ncbi:MAG: CinA family protein [Proteobacteria bacterium]|nr:CinA family protein [Pseudomonadota bacterium]MBW3616380.1 CinA family protein [Pseudomonadota bacterium]
MTETLTDALPDHLDRAVDQVLKAACARELMLVTAESCTGGLLASALTDVSGQAHAFERGFVTYTNDAKAEVLGVDRAILDDPGPVSEPVARAMAEGALKNSRGHFALSVTGFAGPAGPNDEPGLVHFGLAQRDGPTLHRCEHFGSEDRGLVRLRCLETALEMLQTALDGAGPPL